jgi:hypothetical protein
MAWNIVKAAWETKTLARVKVKVKLFLCLTKYHTLKSLLLASGGIAPNIRNLGTR